MTNQPLVSIIIPTFNRADLISETLNSIVAQTYINWECIVVDDGSTENNLDILNKYSTSDSRFIVLERKKNNRPKGANACRNIGLEKSSGDFVIFFDSDDIMLPDHVELKVNAIENSDLDYCIFRSDYFNNSENIHPFNYRGTFELPITADNYCTQQINWITFDPIIKAEIAKSIVFNENLQANQEYNYFCKLTLKSSKAKAFDKILTHRRFDVNSIQGKIYTSQSYVDKLYHGYLETYKDISKICSQTSKRFLLHKILELIYRNKELYKLDKNYLNKQVLKEFGILKGLSKLKTINIKS